MAVSNVEIMIFSNGKKLAFSKNLEALWKSLAVSADGNDNGLTISENVGKFDFNGKILGGIGAPSANGQALVFDMIGANSGLAPLDIGGKIPSSYLPSSVMEFKGAYNATTNNPTLANGTGDSGDFYRVTVAGTHDFGAGAIDFVNGDYVMYSGTVWEKGHSGADAVNSVNGQAGVVVLTTDDIAEGTTSKYYNTSTAASDLIASTITSGDTTHAPSGGSVFTALAGKADASSIGGSQYASFINEETNPMTMGKFVKMLVSGQVTLLASTDAVNDETFFGCVKDASIAEGASGNVYLPEVGARVTGFTALDVTKLLYATTAGGFTQTRPTTGKVITLGRPVSATEILFIGRFDFEYA